VLGASVRGTSHVRRGVGCEDAFAWRTAGHLTVLAVADGAGSRSPTSALGSYSAVRAVTAAVDDGQFRDAYHLGGPSGLRWLFHRALTALAAEATGLGLEVDQLATTLTVAILDTDQVHIGQIGDGIAVIRHSCGVESVAVGRRGEYAGGTDFLTAAGALPRRLALYEGSGVDACTLSTDGLAYQITDIRLRTPFEQFFVDSWAYVAGENATSAAIESFLADVEDQTGDDKTLVVAVRDYEGPPGEPYRASIEPTILSPDDEPANSAAISERETR